MRESGFAGAEVEAERRRGVRRAAWVLVKLFLFFFAAFAWALWAALRGGRPLF